MWCSVCNSTHISGYALTHETTVNTTYEQAHCKKTAIHDNPLTLTDTTHHILQSTKTLATHIFYTAVYIKLHDTLYDKREKASVDPFFKLAKY